MLDVKARAAWGVEVGEDPLHVYKRLLESLDFRSREAVFAARCLQALLSPTNAANRHFADRREEPTGCVRACRCISTPGS